MGADGRRRHRAHQEGTDEVTSSEREKVTIAAIIDMHGADGILAYQRLCDEFGPATVHRYLLDVLERRQVPANDPRRI